MKLLKYIRKIVWSLIVAFMIGWHNFYYPLDKHLLQGDSKWKIEIVEEQEDEGEE